MKELLSQNLNSLKKFDDNPSIYDAYAMHLLGATRGRKLLSSSDDTQTSKILPANVINANRELLKDKTVGEAKEAIADYMERNGGDFEFDQSTFQQDVLPELTEAAEKPDLDAILGEYASKEVVSQEAVDKLKRNIMRAKADLASGGQGPERVTMDDLLGSIFSLNIENEELENQMLNAAFEGRLDELEGLIEENL